MATVSPLSPKPYVPVACAAALAMGAAAVRGQGPDGPSRGAGGEGQADDGTRSALEVGRGDLHDRLYPDRWPEPVEPVTSEQHWQLLEVAGKQLRRFGDDTVWTPLVNMHGFLFYRWPVKGFSNGDTTTGTGLRQGK